jgi:hypothetical protein
MGFNSAFKGLSKIRKRSVLGSARDLNRSGIEGLIAQK